MIQRRADCNETCCSKVTSVSKLKEFIAECQGELLCCGITWGVVLENTDVSSQFLNRHDVTFTHMLQVKCKQLTNKYKDWGIYM